MKESEAKTKWCPFTRYIGQVNGDAKAVNIAVDSTVCLGSECMMWRESSAPPITKSVHGYCGLSGEKK